MTSESKKVDNAPEVLFSARQFQEALKTEALGRSFVYFRETETTMEDTKLFWSKGAASGTLVLAESQTKGRGRQGRQWSSLPKGNLYFTALLECPTADLAKFGFAVPVAVARACADEKVGCRLLIYCGSQLLMPLRLLAGRGARQVAERRVGGLAEAVRHAAHLGRGRLGGAHAHRRRGTTRAVRCVCAALHAVAAHWRCSRSCCSLLIVRRGQINVNEDMTKNPDTELRASATSLFNAKKGQTTAREPSW